MKGHISKSSRKQRQIHFFQQGYISQVSPNRIINWGLSIQMPETLRDIDLSNYSSTLKILKETKGLIISLQIPLCNSLSNSVIQLLSGVFSYNLVLKIIWRWFKVYRCMSAGYIEMSHIIYEHPRILMFMGP